MKAISKFRGCIRQVERLNPSGASELDINKCVRIIFAEDPEEKRGFLFDHDLIQAPVIDLNEGNEGYTPNDDDHSPIDISTSQPIRRKKEKLRRLQEIEKNLNFEAFAKGNQEILEVLKRGQEQRENERITMNQAMMLKAENDKKKLDLQQE
ncbi:uncharacterized protein LOC109833555 [Asparagus officinalis]|uniref:uncharacterized protein LOC109833555 n=1 Tax=Asparagus officinalis TaxID=4686 RepID=UPI00098E4217|nr:uncharacterized protein LOC109833555 [Asparagus officinalis]